LWEEEMRDKVDGALLFLLFGMLTLIAFGILTS
jgi:hypothetical protein